MKLISPSVKILQVKPKDIKLYPKDYPDDTLNSKLLQEELLKVIYKQIEIAGRTCYKSEDKITDTSAKEFTERMIKSGHTAMLEQGTVYLKIKLWKDEFSFESNPIVTRYTENPFTSCKFWNTDCYITTNYRVLVENDWLDDLQYICKPTKYHEKRTMVRFVCDRGVSHELVRHKQLCVA